MRPLKPLPVDPERLATQFPDLAEEDLEAYAAVTRRVLRDPAKKGRVLREIMVLARSARERETRGVTLTLDESMALRYLRAVEKMQRSTTRLA